MLTREQILATKDNPKTETVEAFGGQILVRQCDVRTANTLRESRNDKDPLMNVALWVIATAYDPETKQLLFTQDDAESLLQCASTDMNKLVEAALRVNGATQDQIENAAKNS